jgi:hypothetical protein
MQQRTTRHHHALAAVAAVLVTAPALAQHAGDIGLLVSDARIATAEIGAAGVGPTRRTFSAVFGDTGSPWFTSNPGFDCNPGTFVPGSRIGFRFADALLVWDGAAFVPTSPAGALAGERLKATFLTVTGTSGAGTVPGFDLAVAANGQWHRHVSWTLLPASGASSPDTGVYLATLEIYSTDPAVGTSLPLQLVMSAGATGQQFAAAFAAAEARLSPPCTADLDGDGSVGGADLGILLGGWGLPGPADLDHDGAVTGADLGALLGAWGNCP